MKTKCEVWEGDTVDCAINVNKSKHPTPWKVVFARKSRIGYFYIVDANGRHFCRSSGDGQGPLHLIVDLANRHLV